MATTIASAVSRVRNIVKAVKTDSFLTDRFLYSLILKYAYMYIKQDLDKGRFLALSPFFKTLPCVDLIEIDKVEACCDIESGCTIMRTKDPLPSVLNSVFGPVFRAVTSIDGSNDIERTDPLTYTRFAKTSGAKYNTTKYYWYLNGYLYFPNIIWPQVRIDALFQDSVASLQCCSPCVPIQDSPTPIPDYLFALIEQGVLKDLGMTIQIPPDAEESNKMSQLK